MSKLEDRAARGREFLDELTAQTDFKGCSSQFVIGQNAKVSPQNSEALNDDFDFANFALNGQSAAMKLKMLEDKFVIGELALLGQVTFFYAQPNVGKTLLLLWMLIESIKNGTLHGEDIFYINADDNHKGLTFKTSLAEEWGFQIIAPGYSAPGHNAFQPNQLELYIKAMIKTDNAKGKVLILDTVKKFADLMDKKKGTKFGEVIRQFSMHGGTIIGLAHVNKHRDDDGEVVYSGTTDFTDDCDCYYTLDVVTSDKASGLRTVKFTNKKNRGDVALEAIYEYNFGEGFNYQGRLNSVRLLDANEKQSAINRKAIEALLERNADAIGVIKELIRAGTIKKTDIVKAAIDEGISKAKVHRALKEHEGGCLADGKLWTVTVEDKNAHVYKLNFLV